MVAEYSHGCLNAWETDKLRLTNHTMADQWWCDETNPCSKSLASCQLSFCRCYRYNPSWKLVATSFQVVSSPISSEFGGSNYQYQCNCKLPSKKSRDVSDSDRPARWTPWFLHHPNKPLQPLGNPWPICHCVLGEWWVPNDELPMINDISIMYVHHIFHSLFCLEFEAVGLLVQTPPLVGNWSPR